MRTFHLSVVTPEHTFFSGDVEYVLLMAPDGGMGVLAGHEPMAVALSEGEMILRMSDGKTRNAAASSGYAIILPDQVLLVLQTAEWPEQIDVNRARRAKQAAQEQLVRRESLREYQIARATLARAMVRLRVTGQENHNN